MRWSLTASLLAGFFFAACADDAPSTVTSEGSSTSTSAGTGECPAGAVGCPCSGGACDDGLICADGLCVDGGATSTLTSTTADPTSTTDATTEGTTSEPATSTTSDSEGRDCDPNEGALNPACPVDFPYCSASGVCGDCTILVSCGGVDPNKAVCDLDSGACVQCNASETDACAGDTPVCDLDTHTCVACTNHSQCKSSACDLELGQCLPASNVISVLPDDAVNGLCTGTLGGNKPYCTFELATQHMSMHGFSKGWTIRILKGPQTLKSISLKAEGPPAVVAVVAHDDLTLAPEYFGPAAVLVQGPNLTVYFDRLDIVNTSTINDVANVRCVSAKLDISRSRVRAGIGPGVRGEVCDLRIRDSVISRNESEGLELFGGALWMRNSFVTENGQHPGLGGSALWLQDVPAVDIAYSTVLNNLASPGRGATIHCAGKESAGTVRASVLGAAIGQENPSISCASLFIEQSILDGGDFMADTSNQAMSSNAVLGLFNIDVPYSVYRWKKPVEDTPATWQVGDPRVDFEGDPRSVTVNAAEYPGADVYSP